MKNMINNYCISDSLKLLNIKTASRSDLTKYDWSLTPQDAYKYAIKELTVEMNILKMKLNKLKKGLKNESIKSKKTKKDTRKC